MGFLLPWMHGYDPSAPAVDGTVLVYQDAHHTRARDRLIAKLRRPRIMAIAERLVLELQEIETSALWPMLVETWVDRTVGADLRATARLIGLRGFDGYDDVTLRRMVRARIRVNRSNGTLPTLIAVYRAFVGTHAVRMRRRTAADLLVSGRDAMDPETPEGIQLARFLRGAAAAGVALLVEWPVAAWDATHRFTADVDAATAAAAATGFDDELGAPSIGGALAMQSTGEE